MHCLHLIIDRAVLLLLLFMSEQQSESNISTHTHACTYLWVSPVLAAPVTTCVSLSFRGMRANKLIYDKASQRAKVVCCLCLWVADVGDRVFLCFASPGAFFLYSSMALLGFFFVYGCLPETKARRLEEIEALFENQLCSCGASDSDEGRQVEYIRVKGSNYHLSDNDASDVD